MSPIPGAERWLAIAATVALLLAVWPPPRIGPGAMPTVGEYAREDVRGLSEFLAEPGAGSSARIATPGLAPERWRDLRLTAVAFAPVALRDQFVALHWPRELALGATLRVVGRAEVSAPAQVVLQDPFGAEEVRATVTPSAPTFALDLIPRAAGRYVARLRLEDAQGVSLEAGPVPVVVGASVPLRIMIEASAPSFELQGLRRWAEASGAQLSQRIRIAQDRFASVLVNREEPLAYGDADILLIDATAWSAQSGGQRERIAEAVEAGLGLLMLGDEAVNESDWQADTLTLPALGSRWAQDELFTTHLSDGPLSALAPAGRRLSPDGRAEVLLADDAGEPLASFREQGQGRVAWLSATGTHRWVTAGQAAVHGRLWRGLLRTLARPRDVSPLALPGIAVVNERARLCVREAPSSPLTVSASASDATTGIALQVDDLGRACGFYWPRAAGWQTVSYGAERRSLYVAASTPWPGVAARRAQDATAQVALAAPGQPERGAGRSPRTPFLLAFAALAAALWWRERTRAAEPATAA